MESSWLRLETGRTKVMLIGGKNFKELLSPVTSPTTEGICLWLNQSMAKSFYLAMKSPWKTSTGTKHRLAKEIAMDPSAWCTAFLHWLCNEYRVQFIVITLILATIHGIVLFYLGVRLLSSVTVTSHNSYILLASSWWLRKRFMGAGDRTLTAGPRLWNFLRPQ